VKLTYTVLIALLVVGLPTWAGAATETPTQGHSTSSILWKNDVSHMVESGVQRLSHDGKMVRLTNGMVLTATEDVSTEPLRTDMQITALYKVDGGKNILTAFWIDAGPVGRRS